MRAVTIEFVGNAAKLLKTTGTVDKDLAKVGRAAERTGKQIGMAERSTAGLAGTMYSGTAAIIAGTGALVKFGNDAMSAGMAVSKLQRFTGGSAEEMSVLAYAAQQTGLDVDQVAKALGIASKNMVAGKWEQLGIDVRGASGEMRPLNDVLGDVAERFKAMPEGPEQTALALQLFGREGASMIPMLNGGRAGLAAYADEAQRFGAILDSEMVAKAKAAKAAQRDLEAAMKGLSVTLGQGVIPMMTTTASAGAGLASGLSAADDASGGLASSVMGTVGAMGLGLAATTKLGKGVGNLKTQLAGMNQVGAASMIAVTGLATAYGLWTSAIEKHAAASKEIAANTTDLIKAEGWEDGAAHIERVRAEIAKVDADLANSPEWNVLDADWRREMTDYRNSLVGTVNDTEVYRKKVADLAKEKGISYEAALKELEATEAAGGAAERSTQLLDEQADKIRKSIKPLKDLGEAWSDAGSAAGEYFDETNSMLDAEMDSREAWAKTLETLKANGTQYDWNTKSINLGTEAGRENARVLQELAEKLAAQDLARAKEAGSIDVGRAALEKHRSEMVNHMMQAGYSEAAAKEFLDKIGMVPGQIVTTWEQSGLDASIEGAKHLAEWIDYAARRADGIGGNVMAGAFPTGIAGRDIPRHARGVKNSRGGLALVGEEGPELVDLPRGANVWDAETTRRLQQVASGYGSDRATQIANLSSKIAGYESMRFTAEQARATGRRVNADGSIEGMEGNVIGSAADQRFMAYTAQQAFALEAAKQGGGGGAASGGGPQVIQLVLSDGTQLAEWAAGALFARDRAYSGAQVS